MPLTGGENAREQKKNKNGSEIKKMSSRRLYDVIASPLLNQPGLGNIHQRRGFDYIKRGATIFIGLGIYFTCAWAYIGRQNKIWMYVCLIAELMREN